LSSHLEAVLELSDDERSQYRTKLAATEPELADAIRGLLSATDRTEFARFVESGPKDDDSGKLRLGHCRAGLQ
jgi:hypothetical protein